MMGSNFSSVDQYFFVSLTCDMEYGLLLTHTILCTKLPSAEELVIVVWLVFIRWVQLLTPENIC